MVEKLARQYLSSQHCPCNKEECFELAYQRTPTHLKQHSHYPQARNNWFLRWICGPSEPLPCCKVNIDKHVREERQLMQRKLKKAKFAYQIYLGSMQKNRNRGQQDKVELITSPIGTRKLVVGPVIYVNPTNELLQEYNLI